jgi:hypothetical protein
MTNEAFNNDDDLFSYDPDQTKHIQSNDFYSSASDNTTSGVFDDISKRIDDTKDDDILGSFSLKIRFAESLLDTYNKFVRPSNVFFHKAVHQTLDQLTNGRFSMFYMYNFLEQNIIRRLNVSYLFENAFLQKTEDGSLEISSEFKQFLDQIKMDSDNNFVNCYIKTNLHINNHVLNNERSMYAQIAEKLDLPMHPVIADPNPPLQDLIHTLATSVSDYHDTMYKSMFESLSDAQYTEKLSELYSNPVRITKI